LTSSPTGAKELPKAHILPSTDSITSQQIRFVMVQFNSVRTVNERTLTGKAPRNTRLIINGSGCQASDEFNRLRCGIAGKRICVFIGFWRSGEIIEREELELRAETGLDSSRPCGRCA
jgi:hypothetical protein